jgi:hypothetical protein
MVSQRGPISSWMQAAESPSSKCMRYVNCPISMRSWKPSGACSLLQVRCPIGYRADAPVPPKGNVRTSHLRAARLPASRRGHCEGDRRLIVTESCVGQECSCRHASSSVMPGNSWPFPGVAWKLRGWQCAAPGRDARIAGILFLSGRCSLPGGLSWRRRSGHALCRPSLRG